jgi:tetratricopeptide (TPR) repeat protein
MRTMTLRGILTVAVILALSVTSAYAQSLVKGRVVDAQNKPVEGAVIQFKQKDAATKRDTKSDKKGEFLFVGLPTGDYTVTASKEGLTDTHDTRISGSDQAFVSFTLRPPAAAAANAPAPNPAAAAAALSSSATGDTEEIKALAAAALTAYNANNYKEAVPKFNELVKKLPQCMDCYMYLSVAYFASAEPEAAENALKKAIEIKPTPEAYNMLANLYNQSKQAEKAAEASKKAAELSAEREATQAQATQTRAAAEKATVAAAVPQNTSASAYNDGVKLWNEKNYPDAKAKFEEATKADPANADAQYMLGMASLNLGQIPAARASFQQYLKISPTGDKAAQVKGFLDQLPK